MTAEEYVAELEAVFAAREVDAYTTEDLADMMGLGLAAVRKRLRALHKAGRLERTEVMRENLRGHIQPRTAYRILPAE